MLYLMEVVRTLSVLFVLCWEYLGVFVCFPLSWEFWLFVFCHHTDHYPTGQGLLALTCSFSRSGRRGGPLRFPLRVWRCPTE